MTPTPENKALLLQRLESHIRAVVGHFRDDVYAWDVVNEVIDPARPTASGGAPGSTSREPSTSTGRSRSPARSPPTPSST